jgi:hypothetical protein
MRPRSIAITGHVVWSNQEMQGFGLTGAPASLVSVRGQSSHALIAQAGHADAAGA